MPSLYVCLSLSPCPFLFFFFFALSSSLLLSCSFIHMALNKFQIKYQNFVEQKRRHNTFIRDKLSYSRGIYTELYFSYCSQKPNKQNRSRWMNECVFGIVAKITKFVIISCMCASAHCVKLHWERVTFPLKMVWNV